MSIHAADGVRVSHDQSGWSGLSGRRPKKMRTHRGANFLSVTFSQLFRQGKSGRLKSVNIRIVEEV